MLDLVYQEALVEAVLSSRKNLPCVQVLYQARVKAACYTSLVDYSVAVGRWGLRPELVRVDHQTVAEYNPYGECRIFAHQVCQRSPLLVESPPNLLYDLSCHMLSDVLVFVVVGTERNQGQRCSFAEKHELPQGIAGPWL